MNSFIYILLGAAIGFWLFKKYLISKINFGELMQRGAVIIDVRTPQEYDGGAIKGSKNIPLNQISGHVDNLKAKQVPIICVCASGMRSGSATATLKRAGIEAYNGGSWSALQAKI